MFEKITIWLCLISYLAMAPLSQIGAVYCHGADGHQTLELAVLGSCGGLRYQANLMSQESHSSLSGEEHEQEQHCGPCTDTPLASDQSILAPTLAVSAFVAFPSSFPSSGSSRLSENLLVQHYRLQPNRRDSIFIPDHPSLRTTVLLI